MADTNTWACRKSSTWARTNLNTCSILVLEARVANTGRLISIWRGVGLTRFTLEIILVAGIKNLLRIITDTGGLKVIGD